MKITSNKTEDYTMKIMNLQGTWDFCLDKDKAGIEAKYYNIPLADTITLPTTVSEAKKGVPSDERNAGYLTDPYYFEGYTWYSKNVSFDEIEDKEFFLIIERTRISHIWIDDNYAGTIDSLCTTHRHRLTVLITKRKHKITIMIDNTSYPVKGGHMTSPDTQTNWNGITGALYIEICNKVYIENVQIYTDLDKNQIRVKSTLKGGKSHKVTVYVSDKEISTQPLEYALLEGDNDFNYHIEQKIIGWSEHTPKLYTLHLDDLCIPFGFRNFKAAGNYFEINNIRTFLRGKHDGLIFPVTGYAPTDVESWLRVLQTAKDYGINHYRFHTCTPPKAAFTAADMLGIYMEPELPFWGTVTNVGEENHDEAAQQYLIEEGFRILDEFGNHPSFVMMSLGNELWGSKERLNEILGRYKAYDTRHLYTQGSNNFQFMPCILEHEDFYCGVRFSKDRLFRGSYAMCDAPLGHIQNLPPNAIYNYDQMIRPSMVGNEITTGGEITIQYGTGTKTVQMDAAEEIIPNIPVVSHEIGQYAMYPDFNEIDEYTGVLKARNLELFKDNLNKKNMLFMSDKFFRASGRFAAECYKAEIETALRSNELAGFQVLDLQDFTGQGTALVGVLNSFMENKGVISKEEWNQFCSETVLLAELPKYTFSSGEVLSLNIKAATYSNTSIINPKLILSVWEKDVKIFTEEKTLEGVYSNGLYDLCNFTITMPEFSKPTQLTITVNLKEENISNYYEVWVYPTLEDINAGAQVIVSTDFDQVCKSLSEGKKVLYYPDNLDNSNSLEGTYCTDFWCYPMFRSISESVKRPVPIGTHGLLINEEHPIFRYFPTNSYSTPQWYDFVTGSRALILDNTKIEPIVWTIDNFERNHKLGNIVELSVGKGRLIICSVNLKENKDSKPLEWLEYSILKYLSTSIFKPEYDVTLDELKDILYKH